MHARKRRTARKSLRSFAHLLLCDAGTAHAAKSFFQLADRLAYARLDVAGAAHGSTRNGWSRRRVAKKHGNYRCFCLRRSFAAGFAMAVVEVQQLPIAAIGALAARDA
ncbi:hypothetical protein [Xanthomonas translucens]|uniref:Secreted protein n=1 Tax=Xanthomonas translucens pv. translucens TaxID=134875 RepID=A0ABW9KSY9_XANCT|nr:hypothetical protein [Xanthomonas translucens]MCC8448349.1 hypothetical protein [Xanthomonas translucens pv. translucens]MCS3358659.1 hypothetical protein [Xanthomonas translucens pv. translucens]MCS3372828.1 hypothetical protein [Xanthomonas translucens pv. translucens]MCT8273130.1 hypothetical protein [Xanthomonas translucens pv. translucens]MCT8277275.1 hypothetical protein [Xanthomonas translucens pv. translucens]